MIDSVEGVFNGIPHRADRMAGVTTHGYSWLVEYDQTRKQSWAPRGVFYEREDGVFVVDGKEYDNADRALMAKALGR